MSSSSPEIRVKFLTKNSEADVTSIWRCYLPGNNPLVGHCRFIFDRNVRDYDWLVVYDDLPSINGERFSKWEEVLACPRARTVLVTSEPSSIKIYGRGFLKQFGWVLTSQEPWIIDHLGTIREQPGLVRFYEGDHDIIAAQEPSKKTSLISTVCSSKQQRHTLHRARYAFTQRLKIAMPELEIFGHGVRPIKQKNEALDSFRYHVAIENHIAPHHWTEKLSDSFLGLCLPFYHGCPNVDDYFPPGSVIPINIHDFDGTVRIIKDAMASGQYERRLDLILEARQRVLTKHGTFPRLARLIEYRVDLPATSSTTHETILSRHAWRHASLGHTLAFATERAQITLARLVTHRS